MSESKRFRDSFEIKSRFYRLSFRGKMLFLMLAGVTLSAGAVGFFGFNAAVDEMRKSVSSRLSSVHDGKRREIEQHFGRIAQQAVSLARDPSVISATQQFSSSYKYLNPYLSKDRAAEMTRAIDEYYREAFIAPIAARLVDTTGLFKNFVPKEVRSKYLQYHYIVRAPGDWDEKHAADSAADGSGYSSLHAYYHPQIRSAMEGTPFRDALLLDAEGNVVYTFRKNPDFATNVEKGPLSKTKLADAYRRALKSEKRGVPYFADYEFYPPALFSPMAFVAVPVFIGNKAIGVLALLITKTEIDDITTGGRKWEELGQTGETYIVGPDYYFRTHSRAFLENPRKFASEVQRRGTDSMTVKRILAMNTNVMLLRSESDAVRDALAGHEGEKNFMGNYRSLFVISHYSPLNITGVNWVILTEIDASEALASIVEFGKSALATIGAIILLVGLGAYFVSRSISKPIIRLKDTIHTLSQGEIPEAMLEPRSSDEIGKMTVAVNMLIQRFRETSDFARSIGEGRLEAPFEPMGEDDILGNALFTMRDKLKARMDEDKRREWLNNGLAKFGALFISTDRLDFMLTKFVHEITEYLGAEMSAVYLTVESEGRAPVLENFAACAYDRSKVAPKKLDPESGVHGRACHEKRTIVVRNLTAKTLAVTSAFLHTAPGELIVTPLLAGDKVVGTLEIAGFLSFDPMRISFVEQVCSSLAATVVVIQSNAQTKKLLEEARILNEELHSREEELRLSEEETRAINEELQRVNAQILKAQEELERANAQLKENEKALEQKVAERTAELEIARKEAERASQVKSVFLANMSHELRTPLNGILGYAQILADAQDIPERHRDKIRVIHRSGDHLLGLINEVLDLSKIEAGKMELRPTEFNLRTFMDDIRDMFLLRCRNKGIELQFVYDDHMPALIRADDGKLRQCVINILGNAVKFTHEGGVTVSVQRISPGILKFSIKDTGRGIPADQIDEILKPFQQVSGQPGVEGGTGLGLAITKSFVEMMGGQLTVESEWGRGSTFSFTLPVTELRPSELPASARRPVEKPISIRSGARVLVVDDVPTNVDVAKEILQEVGFEIHTAENGKVAVEKFLALKPELILMDIKMPVMDGFEATRRIRQSEGGDKVKIIAVTASVFEQSRQKVIDAGCDDYVAKPYKKQDLFSAISRHLNVEMIFKPNVNIVAEPAAPVDMDFAAVAQNLPPDYLAALENANDYGDYDEAEKILSDLQVYPPLAEFVKSALEKLRSSRYDEFDKLLTKIKAASNRS
jgi:signal transduction histidine kinase/CheY-like chemotaxis protein/HAMP domain-containing protein